MPKIGIILAGGASKGAYEIGCMRALIEHFGMEDIKCVSSASIGGLIAQGYGMGSIDDVINIWRNINTKKHGRFFLTYSGNEDMLAAVSSVVDHDVTIPFEHFVSIWNFTQRKVEYIPFHELSGERLQQYTRGALAIPFFSKGELIDGDRILDGAFLDNIPAYPLLQKELDFIFCIYFDNCKYFFENEEFDSKIIKLCDFPNEKMLELMTFNPEDFDNMVQYGYEYTKKVINELFTTDNIEEIYKAIKKREDEQNLEYKPRLTADIVLNNINVMTKKYAKRMSHRKKESQK